MISGRKNVFSDRVPPVAARKFTITYRNPENGRKLWITNAHEASLFIVFATADPTAGYKGITAFLVERGTEGCSVGKKENKLGIRASSTCEVILEDCIVPESNLLGDPGRGNQLNKS